MKKLKQIAVLSLVVLTSIMVVGCSGNSRGEIERNAAGEIVWSAKTERVIRWDFFQSIDNAYRNIKLKDVYIDKYYGTYGDNVAVIMKIIGVEGPPSIPPPYEVAGYVFECMSWDAITIWNDGNFYSLQSAYDESFITIENLETIHNLHKA